MLGRGMLTVSPLRDQVAAVSCGISRGVAVLDLDYEEDSEAQTDANFVITGSGGLVELQGTAEGAPFTDAQFLEMLALAKLGTGRLVELQKAAVA
jgi:ribonuclease PH